MTVTAADEGARRAELGRNLTAVRARMAQAAADAGRRAEELTLVAVTKTFPVADVRLLAELGVGDVGENRAREGADKHAQAPSGLRWHFVGSVQRNKAGLVASYADVVHSVDRPELVTLLDRHAATRERTLGALLQVSLDDTPGRGGMSAGDLLPLAAAVAGCVHLHLRGVMAVAPLGGDAAAAFARLQALAEAVRAEHPEATWVSAGMSGDLEAAVAHGATHVRIGTALLGRRTSPVG